MYRAKRRAKRRVNDHIKHYTYVYSWFNNNEPVYEEYDVCSKDGEVNGVYYTNPDPSLPIEHYYVVGNRILEGSEKTGE
jgi:hypothetical protein